MILAFSRCVRFVLGVCLIAAVGGAAAQETLTADQPPSDIVGEVVESYTWSEDTLLDIARADGLGLLEVMAANPGVDPWLPGKATFIVLPSAHILPDAPRKGIVINLAELRVYFFDGEGQVHTFPIGVGREGFTTPTGTTSIVRKRAHPEWYPTSNARSENPELPARVPAGPDNPLGDYAMYLGWPTYLIHGTSKPWGVGRRVSRGCIRLYPEDIEWLFENVKVGTPVTVVNQTFKYGRKNGDLYVEVHPSHAQLDQIEETGAMTFEETPDQTDRVLTVAKPEEISRIDWAAVDRAFAERRGLPVRITHPATPTPPTRDEPQRLGSPELGTGTMPPLEKSGPATSPIMPGSVPPRSSGPRDSRLKSSSSHG
jgi:L,D-transpeptidase ErfK/SrfK